MQPLLPRGYAILLLPFKLPVCWIQLDLKSVPWLLRWVTCYLLEGGIKNMGLKTILMPPQKGDCASRADEQIGHFDDVLKCVRVLAALKITKTLYGLVCLRNRKSFSGRMETSFSFLFLSGPSTSIKS